MRFLSLIAVVFAMLAGATQVRAEQETSAQSTLNTRIRSKLLIEPGLEPPAGVQKRLREGGNVQILLTIPDAAKRDGPLLNPDSVQVKWKDQVLTRFVYYTTPKIAVVLASFPKEEVAAENKGELEVSGRLYGSDSADLGWRLPLAFSADDATTFALAMAKRSGRTIRVVDEEGKPVPKALVFGQQIGNLFTTAGDDGAVLLDNNARNSSTPHFAWTSEHWTSGIDPVTTQTITLARKDASRDVPVHFTITDEQGVGVKEAVLLVDETNQYFHYEPGKSESCVMPWKPNAQVVVIVAGYDPKRVSIPQGGKEMIVRMDSPLPGSRQK